MIVFVYVNTGKQVGDPEHLKVFATADERSNGLRKGSGMNCIAGATKTLAFGSAIRNSLE